MTQHPNTQPQPRKTPHNAVSFFVPGTPTPQGSKNAYIRGGRAILVETNKKLPTWRQTIAHIAAQQQHKIPKGTPISLTIEFILPRTKAMGTKPAPPMTQKPDLDKLLRAVGDALTQSEIIHDDNQITTTHAHKRRAKPQEPTGAHITLQEAQ